MKNITFRIMKMNKMSTTNENSEITALDHRLSWLRRDAIEILAKLDQSESLLEVEEILEEEKWLATSKEYKIFDFIRSLALIATYLRPESFEETRNSLTEFWKDMVCEDDGIDCEMELSVSH
jgi:hypothetical protein